MALPNSCLMGEKGARANRSLSGLKEGLLCPIDWAQGLSPRWEVHLRMWDWSVHALGDEYRGGVDDYCYYLFLRSHLRP